MLSFSVLNITVGSAGICSCKPVIKLFRCNNVACSLQRRALERLLTALPLVPFSAPSLTCLHLSVTWYSVQSHKTRFSTGCFLQLGLTGWQHFAHGNLSICTPLLYRTEESFHTGVTDDHRYFLHMKIPVLQFPLCVVVYRWSADLSFW